MHVSFALFADAANLSQEGKLNILGVFDAVQVGGFPTLHPRAHLVVHLKGSRSDTGSHTVGLHWINPQGAELWSSNAELSITDPPPGITELDLPLIAPIDLPLDSAGTYTMGITLDQIPRTELKLQVRSGAPIAAAGGLVS